MRILTLLTIVFCLTGVCWSEDRPLDALVRLPAGGVGVMISSDGLITVPTRLAAPGQVLLGADKTQAKVTHRKPGAPFALMKVSGGPYPTLPLGDCSLLHAGQEVNVWTPQGARSVKIHQQSTDVKTNLQYLTLELPFEENLCGWPVLNSAGEVVAFLYDTDPSRPERARAVASQELKLFLFNEGLPALNRGEVGSQSSAVKVVEWEFPLQSSGAQRMGDLLELNRWRTAYGSQGAQIAPLLVDSSQRLFLVTYTGSVYCLDVGKQLMLWRGELGSGGIVTAPPQLVGDRLLVSNGKLGDLSVGYLRTGLLLPDLARDISGRARNAIVVNAGQTYALSANTSEEIWKVPTRFPAPVLLSGNKMLVSGLGLIGSFDIASGKYYWYYDQQQRGKRALWYALSAVRGNTAYGVRVPVALHGGMDSQESLHLKADDNFEIVAVDIRDGREVWSTELRGTSNSLQPLGPKLSLDGDRIVAVLPRTLVTVDVESGKLLSSLTRTDRALSDQLMVRGNVMYAGDSNGWYAIRVSDGQRLWSCPAPTPEAAPIWHEGVVYGMSHHSLVAMDAWTGRLLWNHTFSHRLSGQPTIRDGYLYAASMEGRIYRLELPR